MQEKYVNKYCWHLMKMEYKNLLISVADFCEFTILVNNLKIIEIRADIKDEDDDDGRWLPKIITLWDETEVKVKLRLKTKTYAVC